MTETNILMNEWMCLLMAWAEASKESDEIRPPEITLHIGGIFVEGEVSHQYAFYDAISHPMNPGDPKTEMSKIEKTIWPQEITSRMAYRSHDLYAEDTVTLKDAIVHSPGKESFEVPWWNCRISSIDGWYFGRISSKLLKESDDLLE